LCSFAKKGVIMKNLGIKIFVFCLVMVHASAQGYFTDVSYVRDMNTAQATVQADNRAKENAFNRKYAAENARRAALALPLPPLVYTPDPVKPTTAAGKKAIMYGNNKKEFKNFLKIDFCVNKFVDPADRGAFNRDINTFIDDYFAMMQRHGLTGNRLDGWSNAIGDWKDPVKWEYFQNQYENFLTTYGHGTSSRTCCYEIKNRMERLRAEL